MDRFKRRPRTGIFSRRWVEVRGGVVSWFKLGDVKEHQLASVTGGWCGAEWSWWWSQVRCLAGATIVAAEACPRGEDLPVGDEKDGVSVSTYWI